MTFNNKNNLKKAVFVILQLCLRSYTKIVNDVLVHTGGQLTPERPALL
jgi:hypothetical protein